MRALGFEVFWALDFCGGAGGGGECGPLDLVCFGSWELASCLCGAIEAVHWKNAPINICIYVYIYIYIYTYIHIYIYIYACIYTYIHTPLYMLQIYICKVAYMPNTAGCCT